jgi:hypothetical protein
LDKSRCAAMLSILPFLGEEAKETGMSDASPTVNFITGLIEQLDSASRLLREPSKDGMLQPDLSPNGCMFSAAMESRFVLSRDLIAKLVEVADEAEDVLANAAAPDEKLDVVSRFAISIAQVIGVSACLLLPSAISAGITCLFAALEKVEFNGDRIVMIAREDIMSETGTPNVSDAVSTQLKSSGGKEEPEILKSCEVAPASDDERVCDVSENVTKDDPLVSIKLRARVHALLRPAEVWMNAHQRAFVRRRCSDNNSNESDIRIPLRAVKVSGEEIDPWYLLEGFGRGADEEPVIPPCAFSSQGRVPGQGHREWSELESRDAAASPPVDLRVVRLKRTYSTYACTTVR